MARAARLHGRLALSLLKRIARRYLQDVEIVGVRARSNDRGLKIHGVAWRHPDGFPAIAYEIRQSHRDRALTIFHEVAHHVYGDTRGTRGSIRHGKPDPAIEARADRFAACIVDLLEIGGAA